MCELLDVSESGYWAWCTRPPSDRELADTWLIEQIRRIHAASGGRYGSPRVHAMLRREGIHVGEKRVARLMALAGLQGAHQRRRRGCTIRVAALSRSRPGRPRLPPRGAQPRLVRGHQADRDRRGVAVPRRGAGSVQPPDRRLEHGVAHAPRACRRRADDGGGGTQAREGDDPSLRPWRPVHRPDCSARPATTPVSPIDGRRRPCFDNAVAETFFATLTKERLLHDAPQDGWATRAELRSAIFEYIEGFYNPSGLHSTLGMRSPVEYEADHAAGDPDGFARARTHARAREKTVDNLRLSTRYYDKDDLTPRNRGRSIACQPFALCGSWWAALATDSSRCVPPCTRG